MFGVKMDSTYKSLWSNFLLIVGIFLLTGLSFYLGKTAGDLEGIKASITGYAVKDVSQIGQNIPSGDFSSFTKAVCETRDEKQVCHDEVFAKCNGNEYPLGINLSDEKIVD